MSKANQLINYFKGRKPVLNIILDGYGIGKQNFTDGIYLSKKPNIDQLFKTYESTQLFTHGHFVGLPHENDMGGSEVGHLTIGAGQILKQGAAIINDMLTDGSLFERPVMIELYRQAHHTALHLIGLLSDGNIHSHIDHFIAIVKGAASRGVKNCYLHILLDGRDTGVQSALIYTAQMEAVLSSINDQNKGFDYRIVSGGGREVITMDRNKDWEKIKLGWQTHVQGASGNNFTSVEEAINTFRSKTPGIIDQDLPPFNIIDKNNKTVQIESGSSVIFVNFRGDRAAEFSQVFEDENFKEFNPQYLPSVYYAGMMVYDEDTNLPKNVVVRGPKVKNPFGKRILELGLKQFRLAESQKYPHVTFFFNGGYRLPLDKNMEEYVLIPSDNVQSFASKPEMKALQIADKACELIDRDEFDYGLINFANPDMVGHSGNIEAVKIAIATVDNALAKILAKVRQKNGLAIVTADHGNADEMLILNKDGTKYEPSTKHSLNPVPFLIFDPLFKPGQYRLKKPINNKPLTLANIAANNFFLLGLNPPPDIEESIIISE